MFHLFFLNILFLWQNNESLIFSLLPMFLQFAPDQPGQHDDLYKIVSPFTEVEGDDTKLMAATKKAQSKFYRTHYPASNLLPEPCPFCFPYFETWEESSSLFSGATTARSMSHLDTHPSTGQMNPPKGQCPVVVHWLWSLSSSASLVSSENFILHHVEVFHISSRINS